MLAHLELLPKKLQKPKLLNHSRKVVTKKEYTARSEQEAKIFNSKHGEIQDKLEAILNGLGKYKRIKKEQGFKNHNYQIFFDFYFHQDALQDLNYWDLHILCH